VFKSLWSTNFKSWRKLGPLDLAPITALFGTNSSGKTSILQTLLLVKQTAESPDRSQVLNLGDDRSAIDLGSFDELIFNHHEDGTIKIGFSWDINTRQDPKSSDLQSEFIADSKVLQFETAVAQLNGKILEVRHVETPQFREIRIDVMETMSGHASSKEFPPSLAESHLCLDDGSSEFGGHTCRKTLGHVRLRRIYDECREAVFESGGAGCQVARE
jgi:AAA15 family ATPase/GTPase